MATPIVRTADEFAHGIAHNPSVILAEMNWDSWRYMMTALAPGIAKHAPATLIKLICERAETIGKHEGDTLGERVAYVMEGIGVACGEVLKR